MDTIQSTVSDFFHKHKKVIYRKGSVILSPGDHPDGVTYIEDGTVRQYVHSLNGEELTLHFFEKGSFYPLTWGINNTPIEHYFEALTEVTAYVAPKQTVQDFLKENPDVLYNLTSRLLYGLSGLLTRIEYLSFNKAYSRVVSTLLFLAKHFGEKQESGIHLGERFSHKDIAAIAGLARETASQQVERLEKKGLIQYHERLIVIPDVEQLHAILDDTVE